MENNKNDVTFWDVGYYIGFASGYTEKGVFFAEGECAVKASTIDCAIKFVREMFEKIGGSITINYAKEHEEPKKDKNKE